MNRKPTYEELELQVRELGKEVVKLRQLEKKLEEKEQTLQALLNAPTETAILVDLEGKILVINEVAAQRLGKNVEELIGLGMFDYLPPDMAESRKARGDEVIRSGKPVRFQDERGGIFYDNTVYPVFDAEKNITALAIYARDITEQKLADKLLQASEERYRNLISEMLNGFALHEIILDDAGKPCDYRFLEVNASFQEMTGLKETDIKGHTVLEVMPKIEPYWIEAYGKVALTRKSIRFENYSKDLNKYFEVLAYCPQEGQFATIFTDITKRKRAEEALRKSEILLTETGKMAKVGGWELDAETLEVSWTEETYRIHEVPLEEKPPLEKAINFFHPDDRPKLERAIQRALDHGESYDMEIRFITARGNHLWVHTVCKPIVVDGKTIKLAGTFQDITDRRKSEKKLRNREQRFRDLTESTSDWVWEVDRKGRYTYSSPKVKDLLGYEPEEVIGKTPFDFMPSEEAKRVSDIFNNFVFSQTPFESIENINLHKNGSLVVMETSGVQVFNDDGEFLGYRGIDRDITERKQAEEALRRSEIKHKTLIKNIPGMVYRAFPDWSAEIVGGSEKISGYTNEELNSKQKNWLSIIHPDDIEHVFNEGSVLAAESKDIVQTYRIITKDGNIRWMSDHKSSLFSREGDFLGIDGIVFNITERKHAEKALRESEEKYRNLFENAHDAIFISQDGVIKFPNPRACELIGYSEAELKRLQFADLLHPEDRRMVLERYQKRLSGDKRIPTTYSLRVINKNGKEIIVEVSAIQIMWEDKPAILNFIRDITRQKNLENKLQQVQKLEAIGTLAGGIAHQFNNALSGIIGNIELLNWDSDDDESVSRYIDPMKKSAQRMVYLTDQLLAYARGGKYQAKTISLTDFIRDTLPLVEHTIASSINVDTDLPMDIFPIKADLTQMQMVLSAVLTNASEAMENGKGRICISTRNKEIDAEYSKNHPFLQPGTYVCLTVEDNGKGMDDVTKSRIFDPFYTTRFQGRGLGMAAVYGIVKNHDGWISVESKLGVGTKIHIYLPALEYEKKEMKTKKSKPVKGTGTILVIEDEEAVMNVHEAMLERLGYQILKAKTGKDAIALVKNFDGDIDLALLDIVLPDMEAKTIFPQLIKFRPHIKVIVCSGYSVDGPAQELLDNGAHDFIQKPFTLSIVSEKLENIL